MERDVDKVIILGSGTSILCLTDEEKAYINKCKTVIAVNKYMAFYKMIGILPTHVYFVDRHENSLKFLQYIFHVCNDDNLKDLNFILHKRVKVRFYRNFIGKVARNAFLKLYYSVKVFSSNNKVYLELIKYK